MKKVQFILWVPNSKRKSIKALHEKYFISEKEVNNFSEKNITVVLTATLAIENCSQNTIYKIIVVNFELENNFDNLSN